MDLEEQFKLARQGKENWEILQNEIPADKYILLPHPGDEYNRYAAKYLPYFARKQKAKKIAILSENKQDLDMFDQFDGTEILKCQKEAEWIDSIIKFYGMYEFSNKLVIVSLTRPYDTCGENLLGVKGITKKELLCYDIYGLEEVPED